MKLTGAAFTKPYVDALFAVAGSPAAVEELLGSLDTVAGALESSEELRDFLANPGLPGEKKKALVDALAAKAGTPLVAERLLRALLNRNRLHGLAGLLAAIRQRLDLERGIVEATVRSAAPLGAAAEEGIRTTLESRTGTRVRLRTEIDPSLLSGFVVRLGSEVFDASLSHRLTRARKALESASGAA